MLLAEGTACAKAQRLSGGGRVNPDHCHFQCRAPSLLWAPKYSSHRRLCLLMSPKSNIGIRYLEKSVVVHISRRLKLNVGSTPAQVTDELKICNDFISAQKNILSMK